jgi:hypothetical protein
MVRATAEAVAAAAGVAGTEAAAATDDRTREFGGF